MTTLVSYSRTLINKTKHSTPPPSPQTHLTIPPPHLYNGSFINYQPDLYKSSLICGIYSLLSPLFKFNKVVCQTPILESLRRKISIQLVFGKILSLSDFLILCIYYNRNYSGDEFWDFRHPRPLPPTPHPVTFEAFPHILNILPIHQP